MASQSFTVSLGAGYLGFAQKVLIPPTAVGGSFKSYLQKAAFYTNSQAVAATQRALTRSFRIENRKKREHLCLGGI